MRASEARFDSRSLPSLIFEPKGWITSSQARSPCCGQRLGASLQGLGACRGGSRAPAVAELKGWGSQERVAIGRSWRKGD